jgi:hypothetical protein
VASLKIPSASAPFVTGNSPTANGQAVGKSLFYKNGYVFLGLTTTLNGPGFHTIDVHTPSAPVWITSWPEGTATMGPTSGPINAVLSRGGYVYLGVVPMTTSLDASQKELLTLDVAANFSKPKLVGAFGASGAGNGKSIAAVGDTLYLGRTSPNSGQEYYVINNTTPATAALPQTSSTEVGNSVNKILVRDTLAYLLTNADLRVVTAATGAAWGSVALPQNSTTSSEPSMDCEGNYLFVTSNATSGKGYLYVITAS